MQSLFALVQAQVSPVQDGVLGECQKVEVNHFALNAPACVRVKMEKAMKRIGPVAAAILGMLLSQASGAEIGTTSWTGFYAGLHGGWGKTSSESGVVSTSGTGEPNLFVPKNIDLASSGALFGGHGGYNWQLAPSVVVGLEADFTGTGMKGSGNAVPVCSPPNCAFTGQVFAGSHSMERQIDWLASLRGRLGFSWGHNLAYVTGGAAWAKVRSNGYTSDASYLCTGTVGAEGCAFPVSLRETGAGWTIGGGFETLLSANWSIRVEYLRYAFDGSSATVNAQPAINCSVASCTSDYSFPSFSIQTVRAGLSYRF